MCSAEHMLLQVIVHGIPRVTTSTGVMVFVVTDPSDFEAAWKKHMNF